MRYKRRVRLMGMFVVLSLIFATAISGFCTDKKVYKLKFVWNDIWVLCHGIP